MAVLRNLQELEFKREATSATNSISTAANNPAYVLSVLDMDRDDGVKQLKLHLQCLVNKDVAPHYLLVIPTILEWCLESGWLDDGRELLNICTSHSVLQPYLPLFSRWFVKYSPRTHNLKRKLLPMVEQGIYAQTPRDGMKTTLSWLKTIRLHKYWPIISNLTYKQLLSLNNDNFEEVIKTVGDHVTISKGPRDKFLRHIDDLRARALQLTHSQDNDDEILKKITLLNWINETPLSLGPDPDGTYLIQNIIAAVNQVSDAVEYKTDKEYLTSQMIEFLDSFCANEVLLKSNPAIVTSLQHRRNTIAQKEDILNEFYKVAVGEVKRSPLKLLSAKNSKPKEHCSSLENERLSANSIEEISNCKFSIQRNESGFSSKESLLQRNETSKRKCSKLKPLISLDLISTGWRSDSIQNASLIKSLDILSSDTKKITSNKNENNELILSDLWPVNSMKTTPFTNNKKVDVSSVWPKGSNQVMIFSWSLCSFAEYQESEVIFYENNLIHKMMDDLLLD